MTSHDPGQLSATRSPRAPDEARDAPLGEHCIPARDARRDRRLFWAVSGATLTAWALHNAVLLPWEDAVWPEPVRVPALLVLRMALWLPPIALYLRRTRQHPALSVLGVTTRPDRRGLLVATLPSATYLSMAFLLSRASGAATPAYAVSATAWPTIYTLVGAALEEVLMRGFILRQQLRWTSATRAQVVTAFLFALMHVPGFAARGMTAGAIVPSVVVLLVQGGVLGFVAWRTRSIVPAVLVHFVNNAIAG